MKEIFPWYRWLRSNFYASNKYLGVIPAPSPQNALKLLSCQDKKHLWKFVHKQQAGLTNFYKPPNFYKMSFEKIWAAKTKLDLVIVSHQLPVDLSLI